MVQFVLIWNKAHKMLFSLQKRHLYHCRQSYFNLHYKPQRSLGAYISIYRCPFPIWTAEVLENCSFTCDLGSSLSKISFYSITENFSFYMLFWNLKTENNFLAESVPI